MFETLRRTTGAVALLLGALCVTQPARAQQPNSGPQDCGACGTGPRVGLRPVPGMALQDTGRRRAIEYSSAYSTFMTIHRVGSYLELPLFAAEYFVGEKLLRDERNNPDGQSSIKGTHGAIATGLGVLFGVNTFTGVWGLVESRHEPAGRTRRWVHSILMLVADAGFLATGAAAESARDNPSGADHHRALAIGSIGVATVATAIMWFWKN
jgi:hypothetical protein